YAIHRPSGENVGSSSAAPVPRNTLGFPGFQPDASSPSIGNIIRSSDVPGRISVKARNCPLGCHETGNCTFLLSVRRCTSPVPSARAQNKLKAGLSARVAANTRRRPSGVQTGLALSVASKVTRASVSRAHSYTQRFEVASMISRARRRPSGENAGLVQTEGAARSVLTRPARSSQETGNPVVTLAPARYASVPFCDTAI